MSQPSIASYFNTRKRVATDEVATIKSRRLTDDTAAINSQPATSSDNNSNKNDDTDDIAAIKAAAMGVRTRSGRTIKRTVPQQSTEAPLKKQAKQDQPQMQQQKLVKFIRKGPLSPRKKLTPIKDVQKRNEETPNAGANTATQLTNAFGSKDNVTNVLRGLKTPTKQIIKGSGATPLKHNELKGMVRKELNFDEVKGKLSRSAKLQELKASLTRIQELEKTRKAQEDRNRRLREGQRVSPLKPTPAVQLKEFDTIELELLTSPAKTFKTPTKLPPPTPDKHELMSPRHTDVSKRILFSPAKQGSPSKVVVPPAYQRFMSLAETSKAGQLQLPFKYRTLIEVFKGVDSVCAMFHNRKECITFKKLKPAVQRMLRKNFTETHLAQIKQIYPDAFVFSQMKMRNYGSTSKADYFQLIICPNVESNTTEKLKAHNVLGEDAADNILSAAQTCTMNPQVMTERLQRFTNTLLQRVLNEHDQFLRTLDPPINIPKWKVTRWHPDFNLENCPDIECAHLPQPPNVEKYSSARDILSTARNLFNCATPMERAMERYEAKMEATRVAEENTKNANKIEAQANHAPKDGGSDKRQQLMGTAVQSATVTKVTTTSLPTKAITNITPVPPTATATVAASSSTSSSITSKTSTTTSTSDFTANLLKGVPKSLLEKVRAKQAAKALDAMTRRPSQDHEATMYSHLPDLARHLRNVFITERKGVLTLEIVIKKIQNSYRACLTAQEVEAHLKLMSKEVPAWVSFHEVRKTMYLKIARDMDLKKVITKLEEVANEKSK